MKNKYKIILTLSLVLFLSGCSLNLFKKPVPINEPAQKSNEQQNASSDAIVKKFGNLEELKDFLSKNSNSRFGLGGGAATNQGLMMDKKTMSVPEASTVNTGASDAVTTDYSKTNNQVEGVEEADIVKTDGKYIYVVVNNTVSIIDAVPATSSKVMSKIDFKSNPQEIFIKDDALAVFGQEFMGGIVEGKSSEKRMVDSSILPIRQSNYTYLRIYDTKDKVKPVLIRDLSFEGSYINSRLINDYIYLITSKYSYGFGADSPLPVILKDGKVVEQAMPAVYYFDMPYDSYNFTAVSAVNIKASNQEQKSQIYLLNSSQNIYVTENNLYINYTKYLDEGQIRMAAVKELALPKLSQKDKDMIGKIEQVDESILSASEKAFKINNIVERYVSSLSGDDRNKFNDDVTGKIKEKYPNLANELEKTIINKIALDKDKIELKASGEVTGHVLNQFSMDENNGYFRIATTRNKSWSGLIDEKENDSSNNLFVLDENLKLVGSIENLAKGEIIYSARFMGDRAYLVTFKQTDPLFAIDLSKPAEPKLLGELKIPGFSNYLQPYDEKTLIGLGKEAFDDEKGNTITGGLKLSLFDVSNIEKPIEADSYMIGDRGSDSIALYDHRAVLFSKDKNLLVIPASLNKSAAKNDWGKLSFSGALIFKINSKKIELTGKIDHSDGGQAGEQEFADGYAFYDNSVRRSLYIDDNLYTLSNKYIKINSLSDLVELKKINFEKRKIDENPRIMNEPKSVMPTKPEVLY